MVTQSLIPFASLVSLVIAAIPEASSVGKCGFFANSRVSCKGRLRCKPSDFTEAPGTDSDGPVCPRLMEQSNGTWTTIQNIIPAQYARVATFGVLIATCDFWSNGTFSCVGAGRHSDAFWEGVYTGSLNAAFDLGQDKWWFQQRTTVTTTTTTTTTPSTTFGSIIDLIIPSFVREENEETTDAGSDTENEENRRSGPNDRETEQNPRFREPLGANRDTSDSVLDNENDLQRITGTRDESDRGDAGARVDTSGGATVDDDGPDTVTYTITPRRVYVCEYYTKGQVGCRNCTEKILRVTTEAGMHANKRTYNCTQPKGGPILKRWNADNGIVPFTPDPFVDATIVAATCIFENSAQIYECHGQSALCPDTAGIRDPANKCLSGKRWTGEFTGDFNYLSQHSS